MKKIFIAVLLACFFSACDVLEVEPQSQISSSQAFNTLNDLQGVVNGMYNNLQIVYQWRVQVITDVASDQSQQIDTWDALIASDEFRFSVDNSEVDDLYTSLYRTIDVANNIIANAPEMEIAQNEKDNALGQAYFVRGLCYFDLSRIFGGYPNVYGNLGVVLKLSPTIGITEADFSPRSTLAESYAQAESDLLQSLSKLSETAIAGKATKNASRALLARYYLYNQQWAQSEEYATAAIGNSLLSTPFATIFNSKNSAESIFELQYNNIDGMGLRQWYFPSGLSGRGGTALHNEFYADIIADPNDTRAKLTALHRASGRADVYYTTKWSLAQNADNFQLLRLAEQYLIRAEARVKLANLTGGISDLNSVRARAGIANITAVTQNELLSAILHERKLEFVGEGQRWFDVIRMSLGLTVFSDVRRTVGSQAGYSIQTPGRQVLPIPAVELRTNTNLEQNEAYR